jgi:hypothetical protein
VANELSPATAINDVESFERMKNARNDIAHVKQRLNNKDPPAESLRELLPRYLTLALEVFFE